MGEEERAGCIINESCRGPLSHSDHYGGRAEGRAERGENVVAGFAPSSRIERRSH